MRLEFGLLERFLLVVAVRLVVAHQLVQVKVVLTEVIESGRIVQDQKEGPLVSCVILSIVVCRRRHDGNDWPLVLRLLLLDLRTRHGGHDKKNGMQITHRKAASFSYRHYLHSKSRAGLLSDF